MIRTVQLVVIAALVAAGSVPGNCAPMHRATPESVSGKVRDSGGVAQIGAVVQLLRPNLSVIASVYTDSTGRFVFPGVLPGRYALKAMGASFLPSLRENVRVRTDTIVNLTLSTLYEVMQWLPAEPRAGNGQKDDWAWTLRSAANRPLLRWLEDGPLVVVTDGSGAVPKLKARLVATGQEGTFGESGERISAAVEETPSDSRELLARVDFAPNTDAGMESMLGFRQDLGFAGSVQSVAAVAVHPEIDGSGAEGLDEAAVRTWEMMNLGDEFEAEVGSTQVLAGFANHMTKAGATNTVITALPFATVGWRDGDSTIRYRMATLLPGPHAQDDTEAQAWMPQLSMRNGNLALEHGLHQEIGWARRTDVSGMSFLVFADKIDNPALEAMGHFSPGNAAADTNSVLFDRASGLLHAAGPGFSTAGFLASVERSLPGGNHIRVSYANGDALVMSPASSKPVVDMAAVLAAARPRRAQVYSLSLSGTLDGTGTRWRASYSWQPEDTATRVAPYAENAAEPYLNLHLRQPIRLRRDGTGGFEALLDLRNLLAEGYQPYLLSDGSIVVIAQDQRSVAGGLAFTF